MDVIRAVEDYTYYHNMTGNSPVTWEKWRIKVIEEWKLDKAMMERGTEWKKKDF